MHAYILVKRRAELYSIYSNEEMDRSKYILYTCMRYVIQLDLTLASISMHFR